MEFETNLSKYIQVLKMAKTPSWEEFSEVAKITLAFLTIVGTFGYLIFLGMTFVPG